MDTDVRSPAGCAKTADSLLVPLLCQKSFVSFPPLLVLYSLYFSIRKCFACYCVMTAIQIDDRDAFKVRELFLRHLGSLEAASNFKRGWMVGAKQRVSNTMLCAGQ